MDDWTVCLAILALAAAALHVLMTCLALRGRRDADRPEYLALWRGPERDARSQYLDGHIGARAYLALRELEERTADACRIRAERKRRRLVRLALKGREPDGPVMIDGTRDFARLRRAFRRSK
jgi:hypothetical protein